MSALPMWIAVAIENGGTLHVVRQRHSFEATMFWPQLPDEEPVVADADTLEKAIDALNNALMEDAAAEMEANPASGV
jgi:predicted RNase H-like HicB family nuclease